MPFYWNWYSNAGAARSENQDFAGLVDYGESLFAVIADGVFSRPQSGTLARALVTYLIDRAADSKECPSPEAVSTWVRDAHRHFRNDRAPKSSVSFLAACFSMDQLFYTVHAGDCRLGIVGKSHKVDWITRVHSLATAINPLPEEQLRIHPARAQLTTTFGTKRYSAPTVTEIYCRCNNGATLATDGFWAEVPWPLQHVACSSAWLTDEVFEDDVSRLLIRWQSAPAVKVSKAHSQVDNLYHRYIDN